MSARMLIDKRVHGINIEKEVQKIIKTGRYDINYFNGDLTKIKFFIDTFLNIQEKHYPGRRQEVLRSFLISAENNHQWELIELLLESDVDLSHKNEVYVVNSLCYIDNLLCLAIEHGTPATVEKLIKKYGANPNFCLPTGITIFTNVINICDKKIKAIEKENTTALECKKNQEKIDTERKRITDIILRMIECGADVNARNEFKETPLLKAMRYKEYTIVQLLILKNADVKASFETSLSMQENNDSDIVQYVLFSFLKSAISDKRWDIVQLILESGVVLPKEIIEDLLYFAIKDGNAGLVETLIKKQGVDPNFYLSTGITMLTFAIIELGAKIKRESNTFPDSKTNHEKINTERKKMINVILKLISCGVDVNKKNKKNGSASLFYTFVYEEYTIAQLLMAKNADVNASFKLDEETYYPFRMAAASKNHSLTKLLINSSRLVVDPKSKETESNLHVAIVNRNFDCVKFLLESGVYQTVKGVIDDSYPLILAAQIADVEIMKLVLQYKIDINGKSKRKMSALQEASCLGHTECVKLLLSHGANAEMQTDDGFVPIILAAQDGHTAVLEELFSAREKINLEAHTIYKMTALLFASAWGYKDCVALLIKKGAKIDVTNCFGRTPLMFAAKNGHTTIIELLVNNGAELEKCSKDGDTALKLACISKQRECIELLLKLAIDKAKSVKRVSNSTEGLQISKEQSVIGFPFYLYANESSKEAKILALQYKYYHEYPNFDQNHIAVFSDCLYEIIDDFQFSEDASLLIKLTKNNKSYAISISEAAIIELISKPEVQDILRIEEKEERNRQFGNIILEHSNESKELKEEQELDDLKSQIINFLYQSITQININFNTIIDLLKKIEQENLNVDVKDVVELQNFSRKTDEALNSQFKSLKKQAIWNENGFNIKEKLEIELKKLHALFKEYQDKNITQKILELNKIIISEQEKNAQLNTAKKEKKVAGRFQKKERRKQKMEESLTKDKVNSGIEPALIEEEPSKNAGERKRNQEGESQAPSLSLDSSSNSKEITLRDESTLMALKLEKEKLNKQPSQVVCRRTPFQPPNIDEQLPRVADSTRVEEEGVSHYPQKSQGYTLDTLLGRLSDRLDFKEAKDKLSADLKATPETKTDIETLILCEALEGRFAKFFDKRQKLQEDWPYHIRLVLFKNERKIYQKYSKIQLIASFKEIMEKLEKISENDLMKMGFKLSLSSIDTQDGFLSELMTIYTSNADLKVAIEMIDLAKSNLARIEEYIISNPKNTDNIHLKEAVGRNFGRIGTYLHQIRGLDLKSFQRINRSLGFTIPIAAQYRHDDVLWEKEAQEWIANARAKQEKMAQAAAKDPSSKSLDKKAAQPILTAFDAVKNKLVQENPVKGEWTAADAGDSKSTEKSDKKRRRKQGNKKK